MIVFAGSAVWIGLLSLTALELVLGIDNLIFISILAGKLPARQRAPGRRMGLGAAAMGFAVAVEMLQLRYPKKTRRA